MTHTRASEISYLDKGLISCTFSTPNVISNSKIVLNFKRKTRPFMKAVIFLSSFRESSLVMLFLKFLHLKTCL